MANLSVKVTAEVADLQAKLALAQSSVRAFAQETRQLADEMRAAPTPQLAASLEASASGLASARAQAASFTAQIRETGGATATVSREMVTLGRELAEGNFGRAGITAVRLFAHEMGAIPIAALGVGAVVVGVGVALAEFVIHANEAADAINKITSASSFFGDTLSAAQVKQFVADLQEMSGVSQSEAGKIVQAFATMRGTSAPLIQGLSAVVADYATVTDQSAEKAADALKRAFSDPVKSVVSFVSELKGATQADIDAAKQAELSGNAHQAAALMLSELNRALEASRPLLDEHARQLGSSWKASLDLVAAGNAGLSLDQLEAETLADQNKQRARQVELIRAAIAALKDKEATPDDTLQLGLRAGERQNPRSAEIDRAKQDIQQIEAGLAAARSIGDTLNASKLVADLAAAKEHLRELQIPRGAASALDTFRGQLAQMEAAWDGTHVAMLERAVQMWEGEVRASGLSDKEIIEAKKGLAEAEIALKRAKVAQTQAIERQDAETEVQLSHLAIAQKKNILEEELRDHRITADEKLRILQDLTRQEAALDIERLQHELTTLEQDPVAYDRVYNQIRLLKAKLNDDLAALDRQHAEEARQAAQQEAQAWKSAFQEISSASTTAIRDMLEGRATFAQASMRMAAQLVESEIANDAKYLMARIFYSSAELAADKSIAQGGLLVHLLGEQSKTAATATGTAERRALGASEDTGLIGRIASTLARWLGFETSKTAATATGAAQRAAAETASAGASMASQIALAFSEIQIAASVSAAEAFADTAAAGPAGLIAAPAAASAAYATVLGFATGLGAAALDTGAWEIPGVMPAILHPKESVLSAGPAEAMRNFFESGAANASNGGDVVFNGPLVHIEAIDTMTGAHFLRSQAQTIAGIIAGQIRNGNGRLRDAVPG